MSNKLKAQLKTRVPAWLRRELQAEADRQGLKVSNIVRAALKDYVVRHKGKAA